MFKTCAKELSANYMENTRRTVVVNLTFMQNAAATRDGTCSVFQSGKTDTTPPNNAVQAGIMGSTGYARSLKQNAAKAPDGTSFSFQCGRTETTSANYGNANNGNGNYGNANNGIYSYSRHPHGQSSDLSVGRHQY